MQCPRPLQKEQDSWHQLEEGQVKGEMQWQLVVVATGCQQRGQAPVGLAVKVSVRVPLGVLEDVALPVRVPVAVGVGVGVAVKQRDGMLGPNPSNKHLACRGGVAC